MHEHMELQMSLHKIYNSMEYGIRETLIWYWFVGGKFVNNCSVTDKTKCHSSYTLEANSNSQINCSMKHSCMVSRSNTLRGKNGEHTNMRQVSEWSHAWNQETARQEKINLSSIK